MWKFHSSHPQKAKICNMGPGPTAAIASTGFSDMYAAPGTCTTSDTIHPTTASIATRPCLSSASLMNFTGKIVASPNGSKPMSPTMPSRFSGCFKNGMEADILGAGGAGGAAGSSGSTGASAAAGSADMRTDDEALGVEITVREKEGVTNALAHEAHAVIAPTVERTFIFDVYVLESLLFGEVMVQELKNRSKLSQTQAEGRRSKLK